MTELKKLPVGIQTFPDLIEQGYAYVDKTRLIHRMIMEKKAVFLSRPRRFGKSLTVSTLEAIFQGRKDLFAKLWIGDSGYDWPVHPVIRIDMSRLKTDTPELMRTGLVNQLRRVAEENSVSFPSGEEPMYILDSLIQSIGSKKRVVVLIDEYDKPILNAILDPALARKNRDTLSDFYGILKSHDANLRFVFLTGVSRFSKVSVFSGINHLSDISMVHDYGTLLGYTNDEMKRVFRSWIAVTAGEVGLDIPEFLDNVQSWYNGYRFHPKSEAVYNPFSCLKLFENREFGNWWFETGTPTFLIDLIRDQKPDLQNMEKQRVSGDVFSTFEVDRLEYLPLLVQTGYLTIADYDARWRLYTLDYPNREVRESLLNRLALVWSGRDSGGIRDDLRRMIDALDRNDPDLFFGILSDLFAGIPYANRKLDEYYFQSLFYLVFRLISINIRAEVHTRKGRIDAVIDLESGVWIFEFKFNSTADEALKQIYEKDYAAPWRHCGRPVRLVAVNFDMESRNIQEWKIEELAG